MWDSSIHRVMRWPTLAVCLVLLAGCNGLAPADSPATARDTVTPVPADAVETPEDALRPSALPPGIGPDGSVNVSELLAAHEAALGDRSFTWTATYNHTNVDRGFPVEASDKRVQRGPDGAFLGVTRRPHLETVRVLYADETGGYARLTRGGEGGDAREAQALDARYYVTTASHVRAYLAVSEADLATVERDGRTYYRVHATEPPEAIRYRHPSAPVSNFTATAYVTPDGFVRAMHVSYDVEIRNATNSVALRLAYEDVGETRFERPSWVDALRGNERTGGQTPASRNASAPAERLRP